MTKRKPTEAEKDAASRKVGLAFRTLAANEILWKDRWESAPNPFIAIKHYMSEKERSIRRPFIDAWLEAKNEYNDLVRRSSRAV